MNEMKKQIKTNVQNNPLNFTNPFELAKRGTAYALLSTLSTILANEEEIEKVECQMQGGTRESGTCVFDFGFGETAVVIGKPIDDGNGLSDEDIKKYLPDEFFEEFNLIPFEVWAAQYSMHKPWEFKPNYKDPMVQIMAQVSANVQPWLDFGELYLKLNLFLLTFAESLLSTEFIIFSSPKAIGFKIVSEVSRKDLLKIAYHPRHPGGPHTYRHMFFYIRHLGKRQLPPKWLRDIFLRK